VLLPQIDADERVLIPLQKAGTTTVILPKANRKVQPDYDKELYKARHLIENFFAKLKLFRAIATRYDKTAYGSAPAEFTCPQRCVADPPDGSCKRNRFT